MAVTQIEEVCSRKPAFRALLEMREAGTGAGERVKAMQCSSRGPASASSLPLKAARALSARSPGEPDQLPSCLLYFSSAPPTAHSRYVRSPGLSERPCCKGSHPTGILARNYHTSVG